MNTIAKISGAAFGVVAIYWAFTNLTKKEEAPAPSLEATVKVVKEVVAAQVFVEAVKKVQDMNPEPPKPELLPEGEFYTLTRVSQVTETGIKGIAAGEKVNKVRDENGLIVISNGKVEVAAKPEQLTNLKSYAFTAAIAKVDQVKEPEKAPAPKTETVINTPVKTGPDPRIAAIDKEIEKRLDQIDKLEDKYAQSTGKTKAQQPIITRLRLEIEKLKIQKEALQK